LSDIAFRAFHRIKAAQRNIKAPIESQGALNLPDESLFGKIFGKLFRKL